MHFILLFFFSPSLFELTYMDMCKLYPNLNIHSTIPLYC